MRLGEGVRVYEMKRNVSVGAIRTEKEKKKIPFHISESDHVRT